jgi:hypothetical protein
MSKRNYYQTMHLFHTTLFHFAKKKANVNLTRESTDKILKLLYFSTKIKIDNENTLIDLEKKNETMIQTKSRRK